MTTPASERPPTSDERRSATERGNVRGEATRQLILYAAEHLFASRGIAAVPLRDIGIEAGQRNHAAVQYHFGDRDELVKAIVNARGGDSEASRMDVVTSLMLGSTPPSIEDIVAAFVRPLAIHFGPGNDYLAFLSRLITEEGGYSGLVGVSVGGSVVTLRHLLGRLITDVPRAVLDERWLVLETSAVHSLARYQSALQRREALPAPVEVLIDDLVSMLAASLSAPVGATDPRRSAD